MSSRIKDQPDYSVPTILSTSVRRWELLSIPPTTEVLDVLQTGTGKLMYCIFHVIGETEMTNLRPRIYTDGTLALPRDVAMLFWGNAMLTASSLGICLGIWSVASNVFNLITTLHYPFIHTLQIGYYNNNAVNTYTARVGYCYEIMRR